jgi:hypothetical protein
MLLRVPDASRLGGNSFARLSIVSRRGWLHLPLFIVAAAILVVWSSCGRQTDVKPPQLVAPETIKKLSAKNEEKGIRLSWERPDKYVDGSVMLDLAAFRIERSLADGAFHTLRKVEVTDRDRFRQMRRFRMIDADVSLNQRYRYRVVSFTLDNHISGPSNIVDIERVVPTPSKQP